MVAADVRTFERSELLFADWGRLLQTFAQDRVPSLPSGIDLSVRLNCPPEITLHTLRDGQQL
jgi:hypothetical protein